MATSPPTIAALPATPDPTSPSATFDSAAYAWSAALPAFVTSTNLVGTNVYNNAVDAVSQATTATTQAGNASTSASTATTQAGIATTQAGNASTSASTATTQAGIATTQAGIATTKAGEASVSAAAAAASIASIAGGPVASVNGLTGVVTGLASIGANTFTAAQELATGANIASASTINLNTATGNRVHITGTTTITAVTLTRGPRTVVFDGSLTLTHHATNNNLPGELNITTSAGDRAVYESDGTTVYCVSYTRKDGLGVLPVGNHEVVLHTGNGHGSTNTKIRRFTTTLTNVGTAITYADSATLGASLTINETGFYSISYSDSPSGVVTFTFGASVNSAELTTNITSIAVGDRLVFAAGDASSVVSTASRVVKLTAGDVVRPHTNATSPSPSSTVLFAIRKVGV